MADYGLKDERYTMDLVLYYSNEVIAMMKNMGYILGMGLRKEGKEVVGFPNFKTQLTKEGKDGKVYPVWEMFFNKKLTFKEKPTLVIKKDHKEVDWVDYTDAEALEIMLKMEGDVFAITIEEPSDPYTFVMPAVG
ncbi:hypothetical protein SO802_021455 [Lithocarpus litseifolius]|uniref:Uncharacterized protein n=1 Tax=Lithocarpus litseifolius TaxID=425828 RepID=A0AAW2CJA6_9ROSI